MYYKFYGHHVNGNGHEESCFGAIENQRGYKYFLLLFIPGYAMLKKLSGSGRFFFWLFFWPLVFVAGA
jgi:hypothetical protein